MTIALWGPQGYEYQYLVSAYFAISLLDEKNVQLFIEKIGSEDVEITSDNDGLRKTVEVQVKSYSGDLNVEVLISWLCHFAAEKSDDNLLTRLMNDPSRSAIFVTTARCSDDARAFIRSFMIDAHDRSPLNRTQGSSFISALDNMAFPGTDLGKKRIEFCKKLANDLSSDGSRIDDILKRAIIWEQMIGGKLEAHIYSIFNKTYLVPQSQCSVLLLEILQAVRTARDTRDNLIPLTRELLIRYKGGRIFVSKINIRRENIGELIRILDENKVLLLTGISFCGKTHTAKYIAQEFQNRGFTCSQGRNIDDAIRFLSFSGTEDRLFLLDDPFGAVELNDESANIWHSLADLIRSLPGHRLLIVNSRRDLLQALRKTANTTEWKIANFEWVDLTTRDRAFLMALWEIYCGESRLSDTAKDLVDSLLKTCSESDLLQPGQLRHLSFRDNSEIENKTAEEIYHLASADGRDLGNFLSGRSLSCREVLMSLALSATTIEAVHLNELAFILSRSDIMPSFLLPDSPVYSNRDVEEPQFPSYPSQDGLASAYEEELGFLDRHGYISRTSGLICFSHPTFEEAAKYVLLNQTFGNLNRLTEIFSKTLACLDTQTAVNAAQRLHFLFKKYLENDEFKKFLVSSAIKGFDSIFPRVQDECLFFLLKVLDFLAPEDRENVLRYLRRGGIENEVILWHNGIPWIDPSREKSLWSTLEWQLKRIDETSISETISRLLNPVTEGTISSEEGWNIVRYIKQGDRAVNDKLSILIRLMNFRDSFIREAASFHIMLKYEEGRGDLLDLVFNDSHPRVIVEGVSGAFQQWKTYSSEARSQILPRLEASLTNPFVAIVAAPFFLDFADEHGANAINWAEYVNKEDKDLIWQLWAALFPIWFNALPPDLRFNEAHLFNTARTAVGHIRPEQGNQIAAAWISWIEKKLTMTLPHDYGLAVVDFLLKVKGQNSSIRKPLTKSLLAQIDTNFMTVNIATFVDKWSMLDTEEKAAVLGLLNSDRKDVRWLKAVALTQAQVPVEIVQLLLGTDCELTSPPEELLSRFPGGLLFDCLSVYCGHPQPLWWLGYHHASDEPWIKLLKCLLGKPDHLCFNIALREMLAWADHDDWADSITFWRDLCRIASPELRAILFRKLLQWTTTNNRSYKQYWNLLLDTMSDTDEYSSVVNRILDVIEAVEKFNPRGELFELFGNERFKHDFLPKLSSDSFALTLWGMRSHFAETGYFEKIIDLLQTLYRKTPPRLVFTHDLIIKWVEEIDARQFPEIIRLVKDERSQTIKRGSEKHSLFDDHYELEDWVSLRSEI